MGGQQAQATRQEEGGEGQRVRRDEGRTQGSFFIDERSDIETEGDHHEDQRTHNHSLDASPCTGGHDAAGHRNQRRVRASTGDGGTLSKVEITIRDRQHGYETVGLTMPSHDTTIVIHNKDGVTHGFASNLFKGIPVRVEGGVEVVGKNFKSHHVDSGKTMTLRFATAPSKFDSPTGIAESLRHALWCDIHPEVKGEVYVIETRGEVGGG